jgi:hypothetical protein
MHMLRTRATFQVECSGRARAGAVLDYLNTRIMGSDPTQIIMDYVCILGPYRHSP